MNVFSYPLRYLFLRDDKGRRLFRRDAVGTVVTALLLTVPFILTNANYFGERGFLDRFGAFCAVLTGFYIAALVGIASFTSSVGNLDDEIEVGRIVLKGKGLQDDLYLSRRQYVCAIFGYLSFLSLLLSLLAMALIVLAQSLVTILPQFFESLGIAAWWASTVIPAILVACMGILIAQMIVTTFHGLYYLIDRLYEVQPKLLKKDGSPSDN